LHSEPPDSASSHELDMYPLELFPSEAEVWGLDRYGWRDYARDVVGDAFGWLKRSRSDTAST
jgi:hypothetical protein